MLNKKINNTVLGLEKVSFTPLSSNHCNSRLVIIIIIIIIITETSKAPLTGAQRRHTVHDYTKLKEHAKKLIKSSD